MKLLFRLIYTLLVYRFRKKIQFMEECETPFRCLPSDLDILFHMNNAKYFSIMDIAKLDFILRSGLHPYLAKNGYYTVVEAQTIRFKKSLLPFEKLRVATKIIGWDEKSFYMVHKFIRDDTIASKAVVKIRFLKGNATVLPPDFLRSIHQFQASPEMDDAILTWNRTLNSSEAINSK